MSDTITPLPTHTHESPHIESSVLKVNTRVFHERLKNLGYSATTTTANTQRNLCKRKLPEKLPEK